MQTHDRTDAPFPTDSVEKLYDFVGPLRIQAGDRFIGKHDFRLLHERPGDADALLLPAGKIARSRQCKAFHSHTGKTGIRILQSSEDAGSRP